MGVLEIQKIQEAQTEASGASETIRRFRLRLFGLQKNSGGLNLGFLSLKKSGGFDLGFLSFRKTQEV